MSNNFVKYKVYNKTRLSSDVDCLSLLPVNKLKPDFLPGQFITVYYDDSKVVEGKAYSISSAPHEQYLNITVKKIGEFSNMLCGLRPGSVIRASLPYGFFYSEAEIAPMVMIAGGIGIAPFRSMITHNAKNSPARAMHLLYSARTLTDLIFKDHFDELVDRNILKANYFVTREPVKDNTIQPRRISAQDILTYSQKYKQPEYFLCGSIDFVRTLWKDMTRHGIVEEQIYTEGFY